ncbi:hypothetical protein [Devosia sp. SL43]|uniref:hypothetical protein n=1 Tax=Devosia sp. SL43 TaxID=2806348 RepID=UPI001F23CD2B|nr:hypothetical protein [Devosia sp. SL43]UJW86241.1 hypothetical protein IM737_02900 [Devosia sp. SL43]
MPIPMQTSPTLLRHLVAGYLLDPQGKSVRVIDIVLTPQQPDLWDVQDLLLAKAQHDGLALRAGSPLARDQVIPLPSIPRPASEDRRPLKAWAVSVYIVAHDVKFAGYSRGVFHWPDEPDGTALEAILDVLVADALTPIFLEPAEKIMVELHSVTVEPSLVQPTTYL